MKIPWKTLPREHKKIHCKVSESQKFNTLTFILHNMGVLNDCDLKFVLILTLIATHHLVKLAIKIIH